MKTGTPNGTTPLMVAAAAGEVAAVKVLIENGADVNAKDGVRAQTPLMYAAASNRAAVIELLAAKRRRSQGRRARCRTSPTCRVKASALAATRRCLAARGAAPAARRAPMPGVDRNYSLNELIVAHGGLTPLLYAVRQGFHESTDGAAEGGRRRQPGRRPATAPARC